MAENPLGEAWNPYRPYDIFHEVQGRLMLRLGVPCIKKDSHIIPDLSDEPIEAAKKNYDPEGRPSGPLDREDSPEEKEQ